MSDLIELNLTPIGTGTRPLALVHGLFGQGRNFMGIAKTLVAHDPDLKVVLVDLPNHGQSPWTNTIDYTEMADQVAANLRAWSPDRPVALLGHSMGGRTVMQLALRHPELVERLVVVDISPVEGVRSSNVFEGLISALRKLNLEALGSRGEANQQLSPLIPDGTIRGFLLQNLRYGSRYGEPSHWYWQCNLDLLERDLDEVANWPDPGEAVFDGPVLWIRGQLSGYVQDEHRPGMDKLFPQTRLVTIKNAGHWVHSEQQAIFTSVLSTFLSR